MEEEKIIGKGAIKSAEKKKGPLPDQTHPLPRQVRI